MLLEGKAMARLTDLHIDIEDIPEESAADAWHRLNIIAEAFIADGWQVSVTRTTYAPIEEDAA
jgi:hypothetical protein